MKDQALFPYKDKSKKKKIKCRLLQFLFGVLTVNDDKQTKLDQKKKK